ncbi:hypothetical protein CSB93_4422 [Pseudomonas paraeruginosa]|uniref:Uncharacterized protein n=1 Tax=Pseudomonas paraeruginosa TaxID=2994495 RepID=A0A2R3IY90_9PSED|nr:hypothetical protein CSB93_4422 [Pseudomonas paraeruginosa]AWE90259.1 hypothetical protein CSC28_3212 [Pseudomonas paraeruginosa]PTC36551.1 hypothetical protein CLJ1_3044 [Pseudomonas aeruginosa]
MPEAISRHGRNAREHPAFSLDPGQSGGAWVFRSEPGEDSFQEKRQAGTSRTHIHRGA